MSIPVQVAGTNNGNTSTGSPVTLAYGSNNASGNLLVLVGRFTANNTQPPTAVAVTDSRNTWHLADSFVNSASFYACYYSYNCGSGANTVSAKASGGNGTQWYYTYSIAEYNDIGSTDPLDKVAHAIGSSNSASSGNTATLTQANELIVGYVFNETANGLTFTPTNSFVSEQNPGAAGNGLLMDQVVTATTALAATAGISSSVSWGAGIVTFEQQVVATTTFSPVAGSYGPSQTVTFNNASSALAGFAMYYTTDGSTPTTGSTLYSAPITVSVTETVKVLAVATDYVNSAIASAAYTINGAVTTSTFSPVAGTYTSAQSVTLSNADSALSGFAQYYTTDGTTPTTGSTLYSGAITVSATETIKVLAVATNYSNSSVASALYTIGSTANYSVPDCRLTPNSSRTVNGTKIYDVQTSSNAAVPSTDSRAAGAPVASGTYPQNSRTSGTFGPGE